MSNVDQLKAMIRANSQDMLGVDKRYKTATARLQAKQELRIERTELLHHLEHLTGQKDLTPEDMAKLPQLTSKPDEGGSEGESKEPVTV